MLRIRVTPDEAHEIVRRDRSLRRLEELEVSDHRELATAGPALLGAVVTAARAAGATGVELMVTAAGDEHLRLAGANGFTLRREVLRLERDLPADPPGDLPVRPFRVGEDEVAWLEANNRAFDWHPDQGGWTPADLRAREMEPWFDPTGFLLHERAGRLVAFCWTKVHDTDPPLGEIFVIGVDPDTAGQGIGRAIVLAGLDHLARLGLRRALLYVESTNTRARALYDQLGFALVATDRWWRRELAPAPSVG